APYAAAAQAPPAQVRRPAPGSECAQDMGRHRHNEIVHPAIHEIETASETPADPNRPAFHGHKASGRKLVKLMGRMHGEETTRPQATPRLPRRILGLEQCRRTGGLIPHRFGQGKSGKGGWEPDASLRCP